jgi:predicted PurR-regulated permease PerM
VAGDIFLRRIVEILPTFSNKRQAVDISQRIQEDISAYLMTITAMNAAVGIVTAVAMYLCGLGDPLLWGRHSLPAQLHSNFGSAVWDHNLPPRRNAELR